MHFRSLIACIFMYFGLLAQAWASQQAEMQLLADSQELLVVVTPDWDNFKGKIMHFRRPSAQGGWVKVGETLPVVVGRNGMAWGVDLAANQWPGPVKKEGDGRSPVGVFRISPAFGFSPQPDASMKMDYHPLTRNDVCVDDVKSKYYGQLVNREGIPDRDWHSSELMTWTPLYESGAVIQYNNESAQPGAGSCIFMHIWRSPVSGTAGCVALDRPRLLYLLTDLDPERHPVIGLFSEPAYQQLKTQWDLPALN